MIDTVTHAGLAAPGAAVAARCARAHRFLGETLAYAPPFALLVLSAQDWPGRAAHPVYGMPHFRAGNLIVAGQDNAM